MIQKLLHRLTGRVLFAAEIEAGTDTSGDVRLGLAVKDALAAGAHLRGAYLHGAYLGGADLGEADLRGAYLREADLGRAYLGGADLRGAHLGEADLRGAYLREADLRGAYLDGPDLRGADLREADLRGAYLREANLGRAYLNGADLRGADLHGACLRGADLHRACLGGADLRNARWGEGAKWGDGVPVTIAPVILSLPGLPYTITILDRHTQVGCHLREIESWAAIGEDEVTEMDAYCGVELLRRWREPVLAIARAAGRPLPLAVAAEQDR
jgi:uncharacterized protein YjbI with pentapeptide repeats